MTGPKYNLQERLLDVAEADELVRIFAASIRTAESDREPRKKHER